MRKSRVKTEQEKEKKRPDGINLASVGAIVRQVGTQGETLGTVGWTDGPFFSSVGRVAEEEQRRQ
jgi:hypothetical protein